MTLAPLFSSTKSEVRGEMAPCSGTSALLSSLCSRVWASTLARSAYCDSVMGLTCLLSILDLCRRSLFSAVVLSLLLRSCMLISCAFHTSMQSPKSCAQLVISHPYGISFRVRLSRLGDIKSSRAALHSKLTLCDFNSSNQAARLQDEVSAKQAEE